MQTINWLFTLSSPDEIRALTALVTVLISIIGVIVALSQLVSARSEYHNENVLRRKQTTLESYNQIRDVVREFNGRLEEKYGIRYSQLTRENVKEVYSNFEDRHALYDLLSKMERFSVGETQNIYDYDIIRTLSRTTFIRTYYRYLPFILSERQYMPNFCKEFEKLTERLEADGPTTSIEFNS